MNTFFATLQSVTILLGIGVLGFVLISRKVLPENVLSSLSRLALEIALPCLIFAKIMRRFSPTDFPGWWLVPLCYVGFVLVSTLLAFILTPVVAHKGQRREVGAALVYQNAVFVPLVIITEIHGYDSPLLLKLFFFTLLFSPFFFGTAHFFFNPLTWSGIQWRKIVNPVVIATLLGLGFRLTGTHVYVPEAAVSIAELVGAMSAPLLLIILGGTIYLDLRADGAFEWFVVAKFVLAKNIVFPAAALGILLLWRPDASLAYLIMLQSAVPPITSLPILVDRNGGDRKIVNHLLVGSFLAAIITIPLAMAVYAAAFHE